MAEGRVASIQRSSGGVPKLAIPRVMVTVAGLDGDWQRDRRYHGGPDRAVCIYSAERIAALRAEGHPIVAGGTGENLTLSGLDWDRIGVGARLRIGATLELEITDDAAPCKTIRANFCEDAFTRISQKVHPGWSRWYARVVVEGEVAVGGEVTLFSILPSL